MGDAAQRVLMNEFRQLSKEKWTNIEVRDSEQHMPASQWRAKHPANPPRR
jgi:hypothetical protein